MKKVLIAGAAGAMGQKAVALVNSLADTQLTAVLAPYATADQRAELGLGPDVKIYQKREQVDPNVADIWLDFTVPAAVYENVRFALDHGLAPVVGTTGLTDEQEAELIAASRAKHLGGLVAPNFGMSAVLLMKFAQEAAKYFPDVEIIEMHHADKKDAPSGTALSTAKLIDQVRPSHESSPDEVTTLDDVRGGDYHGIKVVAFAL